MEFFVMKMLTSKERPSLWRRRSMNSCGPFSSLDVVRRDPRPPQFHRSGLKNALFSGDGGPAVRQGGRCSVFRREADCANQTRQALAAGLQACSAGPPG